MRNEFMELKCRNNNADGLQTQLALFDIWLILEYKLWEILNDTFIKK